MRILIAEDDTASRLILAQILKQLGHDVTATANGAEAWRVFEREHVPLLISDWMMPDPDGLELCRRVRAADRGKYTYIILLTALGGKENYLEAMSAGVDDFVTKPFDADQLHARVRVAERILGLQRELTHLELSQQQVIRQERLRALGEMASGIAHDFANALSSIIGFSSILLRNPADLDDKEKVRRYLGLICKSGEDASQLVRRMREFYRQRNHVEVFKPVNLNDVATMAVSLTEPKWRTQARADGSKIEVETRLTEIPLVRGNEAELRDVLINLIFNAVDAMPHGGRLMIGTGVDDTHGTVLVEVRDTGSGMAEDVRRRCLEPFFTTKGERGTGLGLAMAYGILQRHGGSIEIESELGKGTTFQLRLPVGSGEDAPGSGPGASAATRPLRILFVEDEPVPLEVVVDCLRGDGHAVETATNGREGLQKFQAGWFDVVVTDWAMPEMSGLELASTITRLAPRKPVIIMLTGFGGETETGTNRPPGVDFVIDKPVTLEKFRKALSIVT
ncbi:MAG: response regulator [Actinobacteria bacterium]|nr:MAG: response regulator [Actinomycetota bacterium]